MNLIVSFTEEQYERYKAAFKKLHNMEEEPSDEQLIIQLKREASAITYAAEVGNNYVENWFFLNALVVILTFLTTSLKTVKEQFS